jgi:hypothetical protein
MDPRLFLWSEISASAAAEGAERRARALLLGAPEPWRSWGECLIPAVDLDGVRLSSLAAAARLAGDAVAGVVLTRDGGYVPVPGLPPHPLLLPGSAVVAVARDQAGCAGAHGSFLSPSAGGLVRITVQDCRDESTDHLAALVLVRPAGDLAGLGFADLVLLGALLQGWDDERIAARFAIRQVAAHTARLADRLRLPSDHALLVHVARQGRYIPPALWP